MSKAPRKSAASKTTPSKPLAFWRAAILATLDAGIAALDDGALPVARRIQKARQTTKTARALLRLAPKALAPRALGTRMVLGSARRLLSQSRDTDALVEAFEAIRPKARLSKPQTRDLSTLLAQRRSAIHATLDADLTRALALFRQGREQVKRYGLEDGSEKSLGKGISRDFLKLREDMRAAFAGDDIEALHDLRKRVIVHRHHAAYLAALSGAEFWAKRAEQARALHEALGNHRDLALLDDLLRPQQNPKLTPAIAKVLRAIELGQDDLLDDASRHAAKLEKVGRAKLRRKIETALTP